MQRKIKTHTFKYGKYHIHFVRGLDGCCDTPGRAPWSKQRHEITILDGDTFAAFHSALHEAMHADGIPDEFMHDKEGYPTTYRLARFLWRLGYRLKK